MFEKNNHLFHVLLLGALLIPFYAFKSSDYPLVYLVAFIKNNISTLTAGALLVGSYVWIRTPRSFYPTLKKLHTLTLEPLKKVPGHYLELPDFIDHIKTNKSVNTPVAMPKSFSASSDGVINVNQNPIALFSRGYAGLGSRARFRGVGNGAYYALRYIDNQIINTPCITFDYPDNRATFDFGQTIDQACFATVYHEVNKYYDAIILAGLSRGATTILNVLASPPAGQSLDPIKAVILESPSISFKTFSKSVAKNYLRWLPHAETILYKFYKFWFPNYNSCAPTILDTAHNIKNKDLPILIAHLKQDKCVSLEDMELLRDTLKNAGMENVHLAVIDDPSPHMRHARLILSPQYHQAANAFLKKYGLPHDPTRAEQGAHLI